MQYLYALQDRIASSLVIPVGTVELAVAGTSRPCNARPFFSFLERFLLSRQINNYNVMRSPTSVLTLLKESEMSARRQLSSFLVVLVVMPATWILSGRAACGQSDQPETPADSIMAQIAKSKEIYSCEDRQDQEGGDRFARPENLDRTEEEGKQQGHCG